MTKRYGLLILIPILIYGSVSFANEYATLLAPLFEAILPLIYDRLDILTVSVAEQKSEWHYILSADNSTTIYLNGQLIPPGIGASSSTLVAHSMQHIVFLGIVVIVGSIRFRSSLIKLAIFVPVMIFSLEIIDVPFVLVGAVEDLLLFYLDPESLKKSPYVMWMNILNNGGRIALSIAAGWVVVVLSQINEAE